VQRHSQKTAQIEQAHQWGLITLPLSAAAAVGGAALLFRPHRCSQVGFWKKWTFREPILMWTFYWTAAGEAEAG
jgi:hypothetical protein